MERETDHYFYVLYCRDGSYYGGYTIDLDRRLEQHNAGTASKYTRTRRPVEMIHHEMFSTKREAMQAEYAFKKQTRRQKDRYLEERRECHASNATKLSST
ncbi:GIY-YIG nuclease family protein [Jeotgalibacillus aurantiacus]|uniref:GIY-YIG nuclease family protein n=1 Tax=Jeotgalibacillus aurantiacus TaxID=2763266 RepID=UPI001D0B1837|nr:GIY-YIG nuclease family protein [Jeotgalibacillus aurantiacus]